MSLHALFLVSPTAVEVPATWLTLSIQMGLARLRKQLAGFVPLLSIWAPRVCCSGRHRTARAVAKTGQAQPHRRQSTEVSAEEVKLHGSRDDCWVVLYGEAYDVTGYIPHHPGGEFLVQAAGRDATALFESIHSSRGKAVLRSEGFRSQCLIGRVPCSEPTFTFEDAFYQEVSAGVEAYFKSVAGTRWARGGLLEQMLVYTKFTCIVGLALYTKYRSLHGDGLIFSVLHGVSMLLLIFNVSHGACHGELTLRYPSWISEASKAVHFFLGASPEDWMAWHNMSHHQHTNTHRDLDTNRGHSLFRLHSDDPYCWYMRYQYIYLWVIYPFSHMATFLKREQGNALLHVLACNFLSWCLTGSSCMLALLVQSMVFGLGFAMINFITHSNDETEYVHRPGAETGWGEHQLRSSANWCMCNPVVLHLLGGINYQIEHHLFQSVHHMHYPALSKIVRGVAERRGVPYVAFPTYLAALYSHHRLLVRLGAPL